MRNEDSYESSKCVKGMHTLAMPDGRPRAFI